MIHQCNQLEGMKMKRRTDSAESSRVEPHCCCCHFFKRRETDVSHDRHWLEQKKKKKQRLMALHSHVHPIKSDGSALSLPFSYTVPSLQAKQKQAQHRKEARLSVGHIHSQMPPPVLFSDSIHSPCLCRYSFEAFKQVLKILFSIIKANQLVLRAITNEARNSFRLNTE